MTSNVLNSANPPTLQPPPPNLVAPDLPKMEALLHQHAEAIGFKIIRSQKTNCPFSITAYEIVDNDLAPKPSADCSQRAYHYGSTTSRQLDDSHQTSQPQPPSHWLRDNPGKSESVSVIKQQSAAISNKLSCLTPTNRSQALAKIQQILDKYPPISVTLQPCSPHPTPAPLSQGLPLGGALPTCSTSLPAKQSYLLLIDRIFLPTQHQVQSLLYLYLRRQESRMSNRSKRTPALSNVVLHTPNLPKPRPSLAQTVSSKLSSIRLQAVPPSYLVKSARPTSVPDINQTLILQGLVDYDSDGFPTPAAAPGTPATHALDSDNCLQLPPDGNKDADASFDMGVLLPPPTAPTNMQAVSTEKADTTVTTVTIPPSLSIDRAKPKVDSKLATGGPQTAVRRSNRRHKDNADISLDTETGPCRSNRTRNTKKVSIAMSLGRSEDEWLLVCKELIAELRSKQKFYTSHFKKRNRGYGGVAEHMSAIHTERNEVLQYPELWLNSTQMLYLIATTYKTLFCVYDKDHSFSALPLDCPVNDNKPIFLAYHHESRHFLSLSLPYPHPTVPIPKPWTEWHNLALPQALDWKPLLHSSTNSVVVVSDSE
ncbi:uncharacterized protein MELLADRAFT_84953 [Melampsora larici-populina 98AG31]|uniref:OTU domain-containing protein n=1 Tax=Melampsora larici-populina (strain 98AG31 / pathotype 3-4-7) TaxID=747676 RepID=F4RHI2_MELLP|nr:uncharacterized protein MELLADRAFT_84953 [Melampsora larici-populina 98AG31]EGG08354.1 hypothetical protein MELLADRAFT_84953 [Melampsora larici-populina 98AG31]